MGDDVTMWMMSGLRVTNASTFREAAKRRTLNQVDGVKVTLGAPEHRQGTRQYCCRAPHDRPPARQAGGSYTAPSPARHVT